MVKGHMEGKKFHPHDNKGSSTVSSDQLGLDKKDNSVKSDEEEKDEKS